MPDTAPHDPDWIEAGRRLFALPWSFVLSVPQADLLPPAAGMEVAFAGRSNVGKSSLLNALVGRKALARTSNTPGRTQMLNFFTPQFDAAIEPPLTIVDMPGYGYARAPKDKVDAWTMLIHDYLRGRANLRRVYLLVDARHGLKASDLSVMNELDEVAVSYQVVLTKIDKIKPPAVVQLEEKTLQTLAKRPASFPRVLPTSSEKGGGIERLRAEIAELAGFAPSPRPA